MIYDENLDSDLACENERNDREGKMENSHTEMGTKITKTTFDPSEKNGLLPRDAYFGIDCGEISEMNEENAYRASLLTASKLKTLMQNTADSKERFKVLVVGLGNRHITADSLGPLCADRTFAQIGKGRCDVCVISPGVSGQTGINTSELVAHAALAARADLLIAVDSLSASKPERLGSFIQIGNCGIKPGSALGKRGKGISYQTVGVPVISLGIPTVVNVPDLFQGSIETKTSAKMLLTARDCDVIVESGASILAKAINSALETF